MVTARRRGVRPRLACTTRSIFMSDIMIGVGVEVVVIARSRRVKELIEFGKSDLNVGLPVSRIYDRRYFPNLIEEHI